MNEVIAQPGKAIELGKQGENLATRVIFDITDWLDDWDTSEASFLLVHQRNGEKQTYPCGIEVDDTNINWDIVAGDVAFPGMGRAELRLIIGETVVKSITYTTRVKESLGEIGEFEEPYKSWVDSIVVANENVNKVSEDIKSITSLIFRIEDGETKYQEILDAYEDGALLFLNHKINNIAYTYYLAQIDSNNGDIEFVTMNTLGDTRYRCVISAIDEYTYGEISI